MAPLENTTNTATLSKQELHFEIRQYVSEDRDEVLKLVANGFLQYASLECPLHDFWVNYGQSKLTDIADIPGNYLTRPGCNFFVVTASYSRASTGEKPKSIIVATTGVERRSDVVAELRRVSVKSEFQRFGLGRMLLNHAHEWAKTRGYEKILACTAIKHIRAIRFYESLGYTADCNSVWNTDPFIEVTHFEKLL
ncbi:Gcn5-related n-acetyltransferase [Globisporangium polare]